MRTQMAISPGQGSAMIDRLLGGVLRLKCHTVALKSEMMQRTTLIFSGLGT